MPLFVEVEISNKNQSVAISIRREDRSSQNIQVVSVSALFGADFANVLPLDRITNFESSGPQLVKQRLNDPWQTGVSIVWMTIPAAKLCAALSCKTDRLHALLFRAVKRGAS